MLNVRKLRYGNQRLEVAKQQALNHLNTLNDLNDAQRQTLTDTINHSPNINSVNQAKEKLILLTQQ